jgi:hypothetical protein
VGEPKVPHADLITQQDKDSYYVGFFASRNAKITVSHASLVTSPANTVASQPYVAKTWPVVMQIASGAVSQSADYVLQARATSDGVFTVRQDEVTIGMNKRSRPVRCLRSPRRSKRKVPLRLFLPPPAAKNPSHKA